jgi:hypothetical protein
MPPYPGFRRERFAPAIALGMETGRPSGEAALAPRFLGSPPPCTQAGEGDDPSPALAPPPRGRLSSAEFHGTPSTETKMFLNAVGVFSFLPTAFDPGFVLRGSRSSTLGLGLLCIALAISLAVGFSSAAIRSCAPVLCLETGRVLADSMKVANVLLGRSNPAFGISTGGVTYNTGAAKASNNGVPCGQVQKALENQANPARPCPSVIVSFSATSTGFAGVFRFRKHGQHRCILKAFDGGNCSQGEWHGLSSGVAIDPVSGLGKDRSKNSWTNCELWKSRK